MIEKHINSEITAGKPGHRVMASVLGTILFTFATFVLCGAPNAAEDLATSAVVPIATAQVKCGDKMCGSEQTCLMCGADWSCAAEGSSCCFGKMCSPKQYCTYEGSDAVCRPKSSVKR